jgi:hypothetical protein
MFGFGKKQSPQQAQALAPAAEIKISGAGGAEAPDSLLAAVIAAAIAACEEGGGAAGGLKVRKIDRTAGPRTAWNLAGLREVIASRDF